MALVVHLAVWCAANAVYKENSLWSLVCGEHRLDMLNQFSGLNTGAWCDLYNGSDGLTELLIGNSHYDCVVNLSLSLECLLDFFRKDFLSSRIDADRPPAQQRDGSVSLDRCVVAGHGIANAFELDKCRC